MNKIPNFLKSRLLVQELVSRSAEMQGHFDIVNVGTNTQQDRMLLLPQFFTIIQGNRRRIKLEKFVLMCDEMEYPGLDVGMAGGNQPHRR